MIIIYLRPLMRRGVLQSFTKSPTINGRAAWVFQEPNYDIDLIVGVDHMKTQEIDILKSVCMTTYDARFPEEVEAGDVIVGAGNFGYGHPHYPSCRALRALGISAIIAESFSPGFYRGESSNGFPLIECPGIASKVKRWQTITFDWDNETVSIKETGETLACNKVAQKSKDLILTGGIIGYLKQVRLKQH